MFSTCYKTVSSTKVQFADGGSPAFIMLFLLPQCSIVVEVPPYHSKAVGSAVQVQFYVCNGKRKRSQSQRFTYLSGETESIIRIHKKHFSFTAS